MDPVRRLAQTKDLGPALILRAALASEMALDAARGLGVRSHLGSPRLSETWARGLVTPIAVLEFIGAGALLLGLMTRLGALLAFSIGAVWGSAALARVGGLGSASALDDVVHAALLCGVAGGLVWTGGGRWSIDSRLAGRKRA